MSEFDALVVGAGIGGLTAAYELTLAGLRPLVVEARGYTGGLLAEAEIAGLRLDIGAEAWAVRRPEVGELVRELGLAPEGPRGASWVHAVDGRDVRMPARAMLGVPEDPTDPEVLAAVGADGAARAAQDLTTPMSEPDAERLGSGDLATLVTERMGAAVLAELVAPIAGGIHGADPSRLSANAVLAGIAGTLVEARSLAGAVGLLRARAPQGPAVASVAGNMVRLPRTLAERVVAAGGEIRARTGARSMRRTAGNQSEGGTWEVALAPTRPAQNPSAEPVPAGAEYVVHTPRVVLGAGGPVAERLLGPVLTAGGSGEDTGTTLPTLELTPGAPITHLTMVLDCAALDGGPRGSGLLVAPGATDTRAKALTHLTHKWPSLGEAARRLDPGAHLHALRLSYGRAGEPMPDVDLAQALRDASTLLGVELTEAMVRGHRLIRWGGALAPATPRARATAREFDRVVATAPELRGVALAGAWVAGTGLAAIVPHAREGARRLA